MTEQARGKLHSFALLTKYDDLLVARRAAPAPLAASAPPTPAAAPAVRPQPGGDSLDLVVQFRGDAAAIEHLAVGTFVAFDPFPDTGVRQGVGFFPPANLAALAELPNVVSIRESDAIHTMLNYSLPETRTTELRKQFSWITGLGVTIIFMDAGIEWRHGAFMDGDGKTRIKRLWDLTHAAGVGEPRGPGNNGVLYTDKDIDNHRTINSKDDDGAGTSGHGSIVAGIAAGNGAPASCTILKCCRRGGTFVGVAPEAEIIAVRVNRIPHIVQALTFFGQDPTLANRRIVVNISMGTNAGPHDGTHPLEQAIDRFTASGLTRFVVVAAGNSAGNTVDAKSHAFGTVPAAAGGNPGTVDVPVRTRKGDAATSMLMFYHLATAPLTVQVIAPGGAASAVFPTNHPNPNPNPQAPNAVNVNVGGVQVTLAGAPLNNGPNGGEIELQVTASGPGRSLNQDDYWIVRFSNAGAQPVAIDCRVVTSRSDASWRFVRPGEGGPNGLLATDVGTITTPATARTAIAVANYQNRYSWCDVFSSGDIASDSGRGPGRGNIAAMTRPTIAAPGNVISAPKADAANLRGNCCSCCPDWLIDLYKYDSGTSMSAPHVSGAIALMLQVNEHMTQNQLMGYLRNSARPAPAPADPNTWGFGKLDVNRAVALALQDALPPPAPAPHLAATLTPAVERAAMMQPEPAAQAAAPAWDTLMQTLRATPDGERFAALVSRHFSEARRLINAQSKVATTWHRAGGPALLLQLAIHRGAPDGHHVLRGPAQRRDFRRFLDQLGRFASPRLTSAIEQHGESLVAWLAGPAGGARRVPANLDQ